MELVPFCMGKGFLKTILLHSLTIWYIKWYFFPIKMLVLEL